MKPDISIASLFDLYHSEDPDREEALVAFALLLERYVSNPTEGSSHARSINDLLPAPLRDRRLTPAEYEQVIAELLTELGAPSQPPSDVDSGVVWALSKSNDVRIVPTLARVAKTVILTERTEPLLLNQLVTALSQFNTPESHAVLDLIATRASGEPQAAAAIVLAHHRSFHSP